MFQAFAVRSSLTIVRMDPIRDQYWASVLACMRMPRGGMNGGGLMHCEFEFVCANEVIVQHIMEDLPLMVNKRCNLSLVAQGLSQWEDSPSISTYYADHHHLLDSFFRLHRRPAAHGHRGYRGSVLAAPPHDHPAPTCLISACTPLLIELCHRKHGKLVLVTSFNLHLYNHQGATTMSPAMPYAQGMDVLLQTRARNHLKKLHSRKQPMAMAFQQLAAAHASTLSDSEGEWVAPTSDVSLMGPLRSTSPGPGLDSGEEADSEDDKSRRAARDTKRPRGVGSRFTLRQL